MSARPTLNDVNAQQPSLRSFTEAVPLSLSSMAHLSLPLEDGVSDGMRQVLQHTLMACVQYARAKYPPHDWTPRDLVTSKNAWKATYGGTDPSDLPTSLVKLGLKHQYIRHCPIYLSSDGNALETSPQAELASLDNWNASENAILGRISLQYASPEMLTAEEMEAMNDDDDDIDIDDMPPTLLYKVLVEYRTLPSRKKTQAVEAEELSMLSFGGSVDDDVKYGALASLYDQTAKYVLEIYSVRGKKYKFDLMDSTLANGTVLRWKSDDPFSKSLCVTVTDHGQEESSQAITKMHLTLEGLLRSNDNLDTLPPFTKYPREMIDSFCILDPNRSSLTSAMGMPSKQTLLLDSRLAGKIYVNGRLITTWGSDASVGTHVHALFGVDLLGIPLWHGRIVDYEVFKMEYARLWQDVLIDARLSHLNIAQKLLSRLIYGQDDSHEGYDDDDDDENSVGSPDLDCLESQLMSSAKYDPVGICAKALATHFAAEFGKNAHPCLEHEVEWVQARMGGKSPVVVPQRVISILQRGGYFNIKKMVEYEWETEFRVPKEGDAEYELVEEAIKLLEESGCTDVAPVHLCFVDKNKLPSNPAKCLENKSVCRYNDAVRQFYVNDAILDVDLPQDDDNSMETDSDTEKKRALLLGMYVAQEHPDGNVLVRYMLRHLQKPMGG